MVKDNYIQILNYPERDKGYNINELRTIINEYPYFQSARALYLKRLKNHKSFKYNNELKITATYTINRTVLFNFITSELLEETIESKKNITGKIADSISNLQKKTEKELRIEKSLSFKKNESYSFNQWLQLSFDNPGNSIKNIHKKEKNLQENIIERFIANNPKISKVNRNASVIKKPHDTKRQPILMTETLARIYLEQKKYSNAIKAYEILSLKYPEKSSFFVSQIKKIRILQNIK